MIKEFRYQGVKKGTDTVVKGSVFERTFKAAKVNINTLANEHNFSIRNIEERCTYMYKAVTQEGKKVTGEIEAFSREELQQALLSFKYYNISITKKLLNFRIKPPFADIVMFISLSSDMLKENLKYDEILKILSTDIKNATLKNTIKNISSDLRQGQDGVAVFQKYEDVFGRFTAYMLGLASKSGNMAEIYDSTAIFLTRKQEFRKNLKQALVMPAVTVVALAIAMIYYIGKILPEMTDMLVRFGTEVPPNTAAALKFSEFLQGYWWLLLIGFIVPTGLLGWWWTTDKGSLQRDKLLYKIPIVGELIHKMNIEIFFRVFSIIYSGSGNNIEVLKISAEACGNRYMEQKVKSITLPKMLKEGTGLIEAIEASGVFTETVISRLNSGSATGSIRRSAQQLAAYYEKETGYKFKSIISLIDVGTAILITLAMLYLIIISSESAFIKPKMPGT